MQLLQLMESTDYICLVGQFLSSFTQFGFQLQVLLKVVFTSLAIKLQQVIELLNIQLVVAPQLVSMFCGYILYFAPLFLKSLKFLVRLISLFRRGDHGLDLFDDGKLLLQIVLLLLLLFAKQLLPFLLDDAHLSLKGFLVGIRDYLVLLWVTTAINILLQLSLTFGNMQLVEGGLQIVNLILLGSLVAMSDFTHTLEHLFLCLILLTFGFSH